jgi:hypothetical protein
MKNLLLVVAFTAILLNIYSLGVWLFSYFNAANHAEALVRSGAYYPASLSTSAIHWTTFMVTVLSIVIFAAYKGFSNHKAFTACITVQAAFLLLYTWQSL